MTHFESEVIGAIKCVSDSILPPRTMPGRDATGVSVFSLTEAIMGMTKATMAVASALDNIADAIREQGGCDG